MQVQVEVEFRALRLVLRAWARVNRFQHLEAHAISQASRPTAKQASTHRLSRQIICNLLHVRTSHQDNDEGVADTDNEPELRRGREWTTTCRNREANGADSPVTPGREIGGNVHSGASKAKGNVRATGSTAISLKGGAGAEPGVLLSAGGPKFYIEIT